MIHSKKFAWAAGRVATDRASPCLCGALASILVSMIYDRSPAVSEIDISVDRRRTARTKVSTAKTSFQFPFSC